MERCGQLKKERNTQKKCQKNRRNRKKGLTNTDFMNIIEMMFYHA